MKLIKIGIGLNGLSSFGKNLSAFEIAGEDKVFHPATARISGAGVVVQSENVKTPVAVRYVFKDCWRFI